MRQARGEYGDWLLNVVDATNPHELIFVDELGFNLWISSTGAEQLEDNEPCELLADRELVIIKFA